MSTHRERNSLACVHYRREFGREKVYRLRNLAPHEATDRAAISGNLLAPPLFGEEMTHARFAELLSAGWRIKSTRLSQTFGWSDFIERNGAQAVLLFGMDEKGNLRVASAKRLLEPKAGWSAIALTPPMEPMG
jgi:hypothetical protein